MTTPTPASHRSTAAHFPTTHWSRVVAAVDLAAPEATEALASLCDAYWYPIYAYVRRQGHAPEAAQDLTQDFFAYVLERDLLAKADPDAGPVPHFSADRLCATALRTIATAQPRASAGEADRSSRSTPGTPRDGTPASRPTS